MPKPQTIVAATDFSANATRAVEQAAHLADAWGAKLCLVHVFNDSVWASLKAVYDLPGWAGVDPAKVAQTRLTEQAGRIARAFGVPVEAELLTGRAAQQIGSFAVARGAGLLVVGEHGEDWIDQIVLGGTALKVLEEARIPVLLVRGAAPASYRNILAATDFSPAADHAIRFVLDCFPDASFALVHAYLVPFESSMRMGGARHARLSGSHRGQLAPRGNGIANTGNPRCGDRSGDAGGTGSRLQTGAGRRRTAHLIASQGCRFRRTGAGRRDRNGAGCNLTRGK